MFARQVLHSLWPMLTDKEGGLKIGKEQTAEARLASPASPCNLSKSLHPGGTCLPQPTVLFSPLFPPLLALLSPNPSVLSFSSLVHLGITMVRSRMTCLYNSLLDKASGPMGLTCLPSQGKPSTPSLKMISETSCLLTTA